MYVNEVHGRASNEITSFSIPMPHQVFRMTAAAPCFLWISVSSSQLFLGFHYHRLLVQSWQVNKQYQKQRNRRRYDTLCKSDLHRSGIRIDYFRNCQQALMNKNKKLTLLSIIWAKLDNSFHTPPYFSNNCIPLFPYHDLLQIIHQRILADKTRDSDSHHSP